MVPIAPSAITTRRERVLRRPSCMHATIVSPHPRTTPLPPGGVGADLPVEAIATTTVWPMPDTADPSIRDLRDLVEPVVVVAFGGWNDAGNAATGAVEHLAEAYQAETVFALDPDDFYDFQVNRP